MYCKNVAKGCHPTPADARNSKYSLKRLRKRKATPRMDENRLVAKITDHQPYPGTPENHHFNCQVPTSKPTSETITFVPLHYSTSLFFVHCIFKRLPLSLLLLPSSRPKSTGTTGHRQYNVHITLWRTYFVRMPLLLPRDGDPNFHSFSSVYENGQVKSGWAFCMSKAYCKYARNSVFPCLPTLLHLY